MSDLEDFLATLADATELQLARSFADMRRDLMVPEDDYASRLRAALDRLLQEEHRALPEDHDL